MIFDQDMSVYLKNEVNRDNKLSQLINFMKILKHRKKQKKVIDARSTVRAYKPWGVILRIAALD